MIISVSVRAFLRVGEEGQDQDQGEGQDQMKAAAPRHSTADTDGPGPDPHLGPGPKNLKKSKMFGWSEMPWGVSGGHF